MKAPDLSKRYLGPPCYKGHDGWRYRRGGGCCTCHKIRISDRAALQNDERHQSKPKRKDEFLAAIDRAAAHMYAAGLELWAAKDQRVRGWRQALARHGLTQRTAAELRRYALKRGSAGAAKLADEPADWLGE